MSSARIEVLQEENAQLTAAVSDLGERLSEATGELQSALGRITQLQQQVDWFKRQLFGRKSEKRLEFDAVEQAHLFATLGIETPPHGEVPTQEVRYRRREKRRDGAVNESGLRFDETVPVIDVVDPAIEAIPVAEREVVGEKVSHRPAQEPGSYKVLKYVRQVIKRRDTGELLTPPAPPNVLERTAVDVSFLAGMLVDKFRYHLPLYRQHQRLADSGIRVSRSSLTNWAGRAIDLLEPVTAAQAAHIRQGHVIAMDETSIKAGRVAPGKMRLVVWGADRGAYWPRGATRPNECIDVVAGGDEGRDKGSHVQRIVRRQAHPTVARVGDPAGGAARGAQPGDGLEQTRHAVRLTDSSARFCRGACSSTRAGLAGSPCFAYFSRRQTARSAPSGTSRS